MFFLLTAQTVNIISQLPLPPLHNHSETHQGQVAEDSVITALLKKRSNSQVIFNRTMKDQHYFKLYLCITDTDQIYKFNMADDKKGEFHWANNR